MSSKMNRILYSHGFDPLKTTILETITTNGQSVVHIEYDGVIYELIGMNKRVIEKETIVEPEVIETKEEEVKKDKPRGWHFMAEYIDSEGNVYHKGVLQS